jgi:hypothetical protein
MPAAFNACFAKVDSPSNCDLRLLKVTGVTCGFDVNHRICKVTSAAMVALPEGTQ